MRTFFEAGQSFSRPTKPAGSGVSKSASTAPTAVTEFPADGGAAAELREPASKAKRRQRRLKSHTVKYQFSP